MTADTDDDGGETGSPPPGDEQSQPDGESAPDRGQSGDRQGDGPRDGPSETDTGDDGERGSDGSETDRADHAADGAGRSGPGGSASGASQVGSRASDRAEAERLSTLRRDLEAVRDELADLERDIDERTLHRDEIESELKQYVRKRQRRGHARGWGPYLVLLYGTAMTLGAFYYLGSAWAILAMIVIWLSTLGLYVVMLLTGIAIGAGQKLGGLLGLVRKLR